MATPKPRFDSYGSPIQPIVDARTELLYERPFNRQLRQVIAQMLEEKYRVLLRRGTFAELVVRISIKDGTIAREVRVGVDETLRAEQE